MKNYIIVFLGVFSCLSALSQRVAVTSPNKKVSVTLCDQSNTTNTGGWYLTVDYNAEGKSTTVIPQIQLGLLRSDQDFSKALKLVRTGKPVSIHEDYTAVHGKRAHCTNQANEVTVAFETPSKAKLNLIMRAYNDGVAFRYEFPEKSGSFVVKDELTAYAIPDSTKRWLEKFNWIELAHLQQTTVTFAHDGVIVGDHNANAFVRHGCSFVTTQPAILRLRVQRILSGT